MSWEPPFSTGADRAEPTGLRRLLRQPGTRRGLTIVAGVLGAALWLMPRGDAGDYLPPTSMEAASTPETPVASPSPIAPDREALLGMPASEATASSSTTGGAPTTQDRDATLYSIYLYKLPGLAPDAPPGTTLDIWVTWKPPVTKRPKVQLLLERVQLSRIEAGFEQGPVADLLVDETDVPDLIYGERFGAFNVTSSTSR